MEARDVPEIEQAAEHYRRIRDERCEWTKQEAEAKAGLIQVMKNLGRSFYQYNGLKVQLEITDNVKVKSSEGDYDEPDGTFRQSSREARELKERAFDLIEQQEATADLERERLHKEAVANWSSSAAKKQKEQEILCVCGHSDADHIGSDACALAACGCEAFRPEDGIYVCRSCCVDVAPFDLRATDGLCSRCWTPDAIKDPEERAAFIAENSDDFTAPRCDECGRIDDAHTPECSKSNALRFEDYEAYARAHYKSNHKSHARKMELSKLKDGDIQEWKERSPETAEWIKEGVRKDSGKEQPKLSAVEEAIDR